MSVRLLAVLSTAAVALGACAPTTDGADRPTRTASTSPERQCFSVTQVRNFRQGGTGTIYLRSGRNEVYEINNAGGCFELDFANQLAILPDGAGLAGDRVCSGDAARIILASGGPGGRDVCRVRVTKRLTDAEVAALPDRQRP